MIGNDHLRPGNGRVATCRRRQERSEVGRAREMNETEWQERGKRGGKGKEKEKDWEERAIEWKEKG